MVGSGAGETGVFWSVSSTKKVGGFFGLQVGEEEEEEPPDDDPEEAEAPQRITFPPAVGLELATNEGGVQLPHKGALVSHVCGGRYLGHLCLH